MRDFVTITEHELLVAARQRLEEKYDKMLFRCASSDYCITSNESNRLDVLEKQINEISERISELIAKEEEE